MILKRLLTGFFFAFTAFFASTGVFAQTTPLAELQTKLISSWLVSVDGENRTRTLKIKGSTKKPDGLLLEADYGWTDGKQTAIKAEINQTIQENKLVLITQADTKIIAAQTPDGKFTGTFALKNGVTKKVTITKLSENELQATRESALSTAPTIQKPGTDVSAACAAFLGGSTGTWPNIGRVWLWVVEVNAQCVAKYSYGINPKVPTSFKTTEIKNGILTIPRPSGTTTFEVRGDELVGHYSGSDGSNSTTHQRIQLSGDSLRKLRADQMAAETVIATPPAADVPAICADFFGSWVGTWSQGNFDEQRLRIVRVDSKCVARYSYASAKSVSRIFETAEIRDGTLSFVCNSSTGGTCVFRRSGDALYASYSNPAGGQNSANFKKTQ